MRTSLLRTKIIGVLREFPAASFIPAKGPTGAKRIKKELRGVPLVVKAVATSDGRLLWLNLFNHSALGKYEAEQLAEIVSKLKPVKPDLGMCPKHPDRPKVTQHHCEQCRVEWNARSNARKKKYRDASRIQKRAA
jgi:hypothetical protein